MYAGICIRIGKRLKRRVGAFKCVLGRIVFGWTPLTLRVLKFCTKCLRMRRTTDASTAPAPSVNIAIPFRIYSNYFLVELPITCIMSTKVGRGQHRPNPRHINVYSDSPSLYFGLFTLILRKIGNYTPICTAYIPPTADPVSFR